MERQYEANRWHVATKGRMPAHELQVLVGVDEVVMSGWWDENRNLWFTAVVAGKRPIYPTHWRPMPRLPRARTRK